jgi:hypothetical protein
MMADSYWRAFVMSANSQLTLLQFVRSFIVTNALLHNNSCCAIVVSNNGLERHGLQICTSGEAKQVERDIL